MAFEYIPIQIENIPYKFEIELGSEVFEMEIRHNETYDYFTIDLYKNGEPLVYGEKIVCGVPLFRDVYDDRFPAPNIIPLDPSGNETRVSHENLNKTVFLVIDNGQTAIS